MNKSALRYVLVTPARNEKAFIEKTILSVTSQTVRPVKWAIVDDASVDGTEQIIAHHAANHEWIERVRMPTHRDRTFAAKVGAFDAGYERVQNLEYDAVGSLDADVSFDRDYFAFLLDKLQRDPKLGLVGTPFVEGGKTYDYRYTSIEHVSGACQLFRRQCFEEIGGYIPIESGGIDLVAVISARMKGWKTRTFTEKTCQHHRTMHGATHGSLMARLKDGQKDYVLGGHPLWELFRCVYQMGKKPWGIGGVTLMFGYLNAALRRMPKSVTPEFTAFRRDEQMARLRNAYKGLGRSRS